MKDKITYPKIAVAQIPSIAGDITANIATHLIAIERAAQLGVSYVVFPELSLTGYEPELASTLAFTLDDPRLQPLIDAAISHNIHIGVGAPLRAEGGIHIGLLILTPAGRVDSYAKIHLHPTEEQYFITGTTHHVWELEGLQIADAICADTSHAIHIRSCAERGAEVYIAGVVISESGYDADASVLQRYSQELDILVAIANHNRPTGGWQCAGRSAIWVGGRLLASANETDHALVIAEKEKNNWLGQVINLSLTNRNRDKGVR